MKNLSITITAALCLLTTTFFAQNPKLPTWTSSYMFVADFVSNNTNTQSTIECQPLLAIKKRNTILDRIETFKANNDLKLQLFPNSVYQTIELPTLKPVIEARPRIFNHSANTQRTIECQPLLNIKEGNNILDRIETFKSSNKLKVQLFQKSVYQTIQLPTLKPVIKGSTQRLDHSAKTEIKNDEIIARLKVAFLLRCYRESKLNGYVNNRTLLERSLTELKDTLMEERWIINGVPHAYFEAISATQNLEKYIKWLYKESMTVSSIELNDAYRAVLMNASMFNYTKKCVNPNNYDKEQQWVLDLLSNFSESVDDFLALAKDHMDTVAKHNAE